MRVAIRSAGLVLVSIFGAALLAFGSATPALAANKALMIGGIQAGELPPLIMSAIQAGAYKDYDRTNVVWPAQAKPYTGDNDLTLGGSIAIGVPALKKAVTDAMNSLQQGETITIVGMSAGSLVVDELLREWATTGTGPPTDKLNIILMADSSRQKTITKSQYSSTYDYTYQPPVDAPYDITLVTKEYDGTSDFPDRVFNLTAVFNAMAGGILLHDSTFFTDLSTVPASNISTKTNLLGGTVTSYLIPTKTLPLVTLLPFLKPMEAKLKATVDKGYTRNDPPVAAKTSTVSSLVATTSTASGSETGRSTEPVVTNTQPAQAPTVQQEVTTEASGSSGATTATLVDTTGDDDQAGAAVTTAQEDEATTGPDTAATTSVKKVNKPVVGVLKRALHKLFTGKNSKPAKTDKPESDASTTSKSSTSSTTSSSSTGGSDTP